MVMGSGCTSSICYNEHASAVVMVTDTCPCIFPASFASNKRWCCGDMYHLDLSVWAFEKLASKEWGAVGVIWRDVPCWYKPKVQAKPPWWAKATPKNSWERPPLGWTPAMDLHLHNRFRYQNGFHGFTFASTEQS